MGKVKEIEVRFIQSKTANEFVRKHHYSGKVVNNSQLHFGCYYKGLLHGVMSFGPPLDKSKVIGLVKGTGWSEMIELNRMAFDDFLPRNSESRCLAVAFKIIRKKYPFIKWVLSFSDGAQSGDGTIYRATGFVLTQIKQNTANIVMPDGEIISSLTVTSKPDEPATQNICKKYNIKIKGATHKPLLDAGGKYIPGFQLRYIYFCTKRKSKI